MSALIALRYGTFGPIGSSVASLRWFFFFTSSDQITIEEYNEHVLSMWKCFMTFSVCVYLMDQYFN